VDAAQALEDLVEISSQIEGAVLTGPDGALVASTYDDAARGERVAEAAAGLLRAADESQARAERAGITQVVVELPDGAVVIVREEGRAVAAITVEEPTVGLVLYDLRTTLRLAADARKPAATKQAAPRKASPKKAAPGRKDDDA
jgi:predicted regulator of Ras-like GTPase activity (Roadblock/LC7/MglB family)